MSIQVGIINTPKVFFLHRVLKANELVDVNRVSEINFRSENMFFCIYVYLFKIVFSVFLHN